MKPKIAETLIASLGTLLFPIFDNSFLFDLDTP